MFYKTEFNSVSVKDFDSINILQDKNPISQKAFLSNEEAITWATIHMKEMYGLSVIDMKMSVTNKDEEDILGSIPAMNNININLSSTQKINGFYIINLLTENLELLKELEFNFINGVATTQTIFRATGTFLLQMNNEFVIEDERYCVFDIKENYQLKVI
jgi:hypothetical protein